MRPVVLLLALLAAPALRAQAPASLIDPGTAPLRFERLSVEHGLSQGSVYTIMQDRQGFMWFGTQAGIDRYDGYRFTSYQRRSFDGSAITGGFATSLYEDEDGFLWAGTSSGVLNRLDPTSGRFSHYFTDPERPDRPGGIFAMTGGEGGALWLATGNGIARLDPATGEHRLFLPDASDPASPGHIGAYHLARDADGRLWAATGNGLARIDEANGTFERFLYDPEVAFNAFSPENSFHHIATFASEPHVFWLTSGHGLVRFDLRDGSTRRYVPDASRPEDNVLFVAAVDPGEDGVLWINGPSVGLLRFDAGTGRFASYRHDPRDPLSLVSDDVSTVYTDRSGIVWVGDDRALGISKFDPSVNSIRHYRSIPGEPNSLPDGIVFSIAEDDGDVFWLGTMKGGLTRFDRGANTYRHYRHDPRNPNSLTSDYVRSVVRDHEGMIWVGTEAGLNRLDPRTGRITRFTRDPDDPASLGANFVRRIYEDREGTLWVAALGSLNRFDRATGTFTRYVHHPDDPTSLPPGWLVLSMYEDRRGDFWIGMGGLLRMDRAAGTFERFLHDPDNDQSPGGTSVWTIHEREREPGVLWLASYDGALTRFDTRDGTFRHYTEEDGLANNVLYGLVEDDDGRLWLSSNRGISRFDPETETFRNYGVDSGLQGHEFNAGAYHRTPAGEIFFGGVNGLNSFFPDQLRDNVHPPQVALTGFKLFNRPVYPGEGSPLRQVLSRTEEVRLRHNQNMLTFEFAALHFRSPSSNRYAYRMEGLDPDWIPADGQRMASYANLAPGTYTFRVRAANSDGVWNEEGAALRVVIRPPWWRTSWSYGFYFLALCGGVFAVDRVQRRRLLAREREKTRERELAQAREIEKAYHELERAHASLKATQAQLVQQEKLASLGALTAGIAHEIKNPLNFITNFSDVSTELLDELREEVDRLAAAAGTEQREAAGILADLRLNLTKIAEHGHRADGIVRSMLAHSRGGTGERQPTDLNRLVEEYVNLAYHGMRARTPGYECTIHSDLDASLPPVEVVAQDVGRVLLNLLSNAFQAVNDRRQREANPGYAPAVHVSTSATKDGVEIRIGDNGTGIPRELVDRIFEPFFTTRPAGQGTGLGLSLSHDIVVHGHGGRLEVETDEGGGTCFTVVLPVEAAVRASSGGAGPAAPAVVLSPAR